MEGVLFGGNQVKQYSNHSTQEVRKNIFSDPKRLGLREKSIRNTSIHPIFGLFLVKLVKIMTILFIIHPIFYGFYGFIQFSI